jgi:hypothetical protein
VRALRCVPPTSYCDAWAFLDCIPVLWRIWPMWYVSYCDAWRLQGWRAYRLIYLNCVPAGADVLWFCKCAFHALVFAMTSSTRFSLQDSLCIYGVPYREGVIAVTGNTRIPLTCRRMVAPSTLTLVRLPLLVVVPGYWRQDKPCIALQLLYREKKAALLL